MGGGYSSLQAAFDAVTDGGTIVMQADTDLTATAKLAGKKATLDLNGKTINAIAGSNGFAIYVTGGANLTIKGNGKIDADVATVRCGNTSSESTETTISYLTIEDGTYNGTIFASGYGNVTIKNGTFSSDSTSDRYAVHTNGNSKPAYGHNTIVINNGTFNNILYLAGRNSEYTINGGTFTDTTGKSAVEIKAGKMSINGGTFDNTAEATSVKKQGNDNSTSGYALAVVAQDDYQGADVTINGGTFKKAVDSVDLSNNVNSTLTVTGGTYVNDISKYVAAGLKQITIGEKYGVAEEKATTVTELTDSAKKETVKEGLKDAVTLEENTTEKVDTFSLSELAQAYLVRATYPVSNGNNKKTVDVDFNLGTASEINGTASFGVVFYNIPSGLEIGEPTISIAK